MGNLFESRTLIAHVSSLDFKRMDVKAGMSGRPTTSSKVSSQQFPTIQFHFQRMTTCPLCIRPSNGPHPHVSPLHGRLRLRTFSLHCHVSKGTVVLVVFLATCLWPKQQQFIISHVSHLSIFLHGFVSNMPRMKTANVLASLVVTANDKLIFFSFNLFCSFHQAKIHLSSCFSTFLSSSFVFAERKKNSNPSTTKWTFDWSWIFFGNPNVQFKCSFLIFF